MLQSGFDKNLIGYHSEVKQELEEILCWWASQMIDEQYGGFYGSLNNDNEVDEASAKGIVLNSRILWTFSAAYRYEKKPKYKEIANRAYQYIIRHFLDDQYGGVYWSVGRQGNMADGRKQIYGLAFCIYGLAEYYKISSDENALKKAISLYNDIEKYSFDGQYGGYIEALNRDWSQAGDLRLSEKDDNEKKSMNTHLHIIEGYANLYSVWPDEKLKLKIVGLLDNFEQHIINSENHHLNLFFDEAWNVRSTMISYGHDIESAWLLQESAEIITEDLYIKKYKDLAVKMAVASLEGIDKKDGGMYYEIDPVSNHIIQEKHWWPQAEAMVGFFNAYQINREIHFLDQSLKSFEYIKNFLKDAKYGEWFWGIDENGEVMNKEKAGFWKCPYHNGRACLEIVKRIDKLTQS